VSQHHRDRIRARLADEVGRIDVHARTRIALCYPSPYAAGMSSLGYQRIYRALQESGEFAAERAFLGDEAASEPLLQGHAQTYESLTPIGNFSVAAFSVAYELELAGLVAMLQGAGIPPKRAEREAHHPFVLAGGPLTFSNPVPLGGLVDAVIMGEAEEIVLDVLRVLRDAPTRQAQLDGLAAIESVWVPAIHGEVLPSIAAVPNEMLPAWAPIRTPHAEFANMFLIESERGCSRGCTYCVMRRSTNGGMRLVPMEKILSLVPEDAPRVGLVGAAVSDHPKIVSIVHALADAGKAVSLSSLRPDRLSDEFVGALKRGGYRTLTTAMDGPSERLRETLERRAKEKHLLRCAEYARKHGMDRLKLYLMIGLPTETGDDIDECVRFTAELSKIVPVALGIAPFCSKRNTPLDEKPYAGISVVNDRLDRLRRGLRGRADVRATSARWAWAEWVLAQGGMAEGLAVVDAVQRGGTFAAYRKAFEALGRSVTGELPSPRRKLPVSMGATA
jgi:radical SAM superfamily enzyme YgiQ (UPF0313 family)